MSRVTRMAVGLVALVPVLALSGSLLVALGVGTEAAAWAALAIGVVWTILMVRWSQRAAPARSEEASARYWVALRHARFQSRPRSDRDAA